MRYLRLNPEQVHWMSHIWRPLYCLNAMHKYWTRPDYQYTDAGYCLDRYSLIG